MPGIVDSAGGNGNAGLVLVGLWQIRRGQRVLVPGSVQRSQGKLVPWVKLAHTQALTAPKKKKAKKK